MAVSEGVGGGLWGELAWYETHSEENVGDRRGWQYIGVAISEGALYISFFYIT